MELVDLPHLQPAHRLHLAYFADVGNSAFLRRQLLEGNAEFEYAFLDAALLLSRSHVLAACFRAVNDSIAGRLKTRNVHSEIVFALSPNNNVSTWRNHA
jgi:EKC/KEOPS complex subunit CGI121/TPRKB